MAVGTTVARRVAVRNAMALRVDSRYPMCSATQSERTPAAPGAACAGKAPALATKDASPGPSPRALPGGAFRRPSRTLPPDRACLHEVRLSYATHGMTRARFPLSHSVVSLWTLDSGLGTSCGEAVREPAAQRVPGHAGPRP